MNQYHRVINIPAAQVKVGDVLLWNPKDRSFFNGHLNHERLRVIERHLDHQDGSIYIKCSDEAGKFSYVAQYMEPFEYVRLDCLETFGINYGK